MYDIFNSNFIVLECLYSYADANNICKISQRKIAKECYLSLSSVRNSFKCLYASKLVFKSSNCYSCYSLDSRVIRFFQFLEDL
jgi:hypothetical protein